MLEIARRGPKDSKLTLTRRWEVPYGHRMSMKPCNNPHGHNAVIEVTVTGPLKAGLIIEASVFDRRIRQVLRRIDHQMLNEVEVKASDWADAKALIYQLNAFPSVENLAAWLAVACQQVLGSSLTVTRVRVYETSDVWADFEPG